MLWMNLYIYYSSMQIQTITIYTFVLFFALHDFFFIMQYISINTLIIFYKYWARRKQSAYSADKALDDIIDSSVSFLFLLDDCKYIKFSHTI